MKVDLREMKGRSPRCEIGLCKTRCDISLGDATSRGGLGRTLICDDCAKQMLELLKDRFETPEVEYIEPVYGVSPVITEIQDSISASLGVPADIIDPDAPVMTDPEDAAMLDEIEARNIEETQGVEGMTLPQLKEYAKLKGIDFKSKIKKDELLILIDLNG